MRIADLRNIGKSLIKEISGLRNSPDINIPLGIGAGGDKTFPIDKRAEEIVLAGLASLREPITVISEELGTQELGGGGMRVVIDPVDGSKNAISGIPIYCTSIAVSSGENLSGVTLSYVIDLVSGDEFWAEEGKGAFMNGKRLLTQRDDELRLAAYEAQSPGRDIPSIMPLLCRARKTRCLGSTALDLAYLASGSISVFVCPSPSRSFDFAGGWLLVKEAGGIITNTEGEDIGGIRLGLKKSSPLLAAGNAALLRNALTLLAGKRKDE
jgi:myo-inositol-1(or 4)-monophosphatase